MKECFTKKYKTNETAVYPLPHTQAHRWPGLDRVAVIDSGDRVSPSHLDSTANLTAFLYNLCVFLNHCEVCNVLDIRKPCSIPTFPFFRAL